tara:strand:+ start:545 stop:1258 length:714 start_codon:yes stop_codon:yes gene_type:complete
MKKNFDSYLFRCSSLGKLMINPRSKKDSLSVTTKTYLKELHKEIYFGRSKEIQSKFLEKGKVVEDDSIAMLNNFLGKKYVKNEKSYANSYLSGTPDIYADELIDIKSSWNLQTFPMYEEDLPNKDYYWQMQGYMALTRTKKCKVIYCLTDTPMELIQDEIRRFSWKAGMIDVPVEIEDEITNNLQFSDIETEHRIKSFDVNYNKEDVEKLYEKIKLCREFLTDLSVIAGQKIVNTII